MSYLSLLPDPSPLPLYTNGSIAGIINGSPFLSLLLPVSEHHCVTRNSLRSLAEDITEGLFPVLIRKGGNTKARLMYTILKHSPSPPRNQYV